MTGIWSHRPPLLPLALFMAAYALGAGFAHSLAIVPGSGISIWPPSGLFVATLALTPRRSWPWWVTGGLLAELFGNLVWFHNPPALALLIYAGNALEAAAGAWLLGRVCGRPVRLETLKETLALIVFGAGIAPVASATVGSAALAVFGVQSFATAWPLWWIGDATGVVIVAPLVFAFFQDWRGEAPLSAGRWVEAGVLGVIFLGVAALSLGGYLAFAYIVMPPLLWAAVRFDFKGAAVASVLLAAIAAVFTVSGASQFAADPEARKQMQVMLQLFLTISAISALIVAAISRQHALAVRDLRRSVDALRDRERELSQLVDMVPSHVWRLTPDGAPTFFNRRMLDFLGVDPAAAAGSPGIGRLDELIGSVHPDDATGFGDTLRRCLATGETFAMRYRLRREDGVFHWMSSRADPMRDQDGGIVQWVGLCHDIDDQVQAEEALRRSEQRLQRIVDAVPVHIWSWSPSGQLAYVSKRYLEHLGLSDANFEDFARVAQELVHPDDAPGVERIASRCLATGEAFVMRYRRRSRDGAYRWMEGRCEPLRDEDGTIAHWYGVSLDIDDGVRAQEELRLARENLARQSQAASLAELSASIAHEVNQPLAAIVANSHACQRWLTAEPPNMDRAQRTVERIIRDANAAADVVSRIRALFRQSADATAHAALDGLIAETRGLMAEEEKRHRVRLDVEVEAGIPPIALDRVQVQQVLINLLRNGMESMDAVDGERVLSLRVRRAGNAVRTEISDCGPGVAFPEKIFEPFFTTKDQGMGMGLAICRSIVESHGGRLWAENSEPRGATFVFTLPIDAGASP